MTKSAMATPGLTEGAVNTVKIDGSCKIQHGGMCLIKHIIIPLLFPPFLHNKCMIA
jgi:hypothetical protein